MDSNNFILLWMLQSKISMNGSDIYIFLPICTRFGELLPHLRMTNSSAHILPVK